MSPNGTAGILTDRSLTNYHFGIDMRVVSALALLSLAAPVSAQSAVPWAVSLRGIGPIQLGMTRAEAERASGQRLTASEGGVEGCYYLEPQRGPEGVRFIEFEGTIQNIMVSSPRVRTRSGIGVGSTEAEVRRAYPGRIRVVTPESGEYDMDSSERHLTFQPSDRADQAYRIVFRTDGRRVIMLEAGLRNWPGAYEYCS